MVENAQCMAFMGVGERRRGEGGAWNRDFVSVVCFIYCCREVGLFSRQCQCGNACQLKNGLHYPPLLHYGHLFALVNGTTCSALYFLQSQTNVLLMKYSFIPPTWEG